MEHTDASNRLKALASSAPTRSKSARLRDLMPDIDHAMKHGVPRSEILKVLSEAGIEMTMGYFNISRNRIKKLQSKAVKSKSPEPKFSNQKAADSADSKNIKDQHPDVNNSPDSDKLKPMDSTNPPEQSAKRFRNQFVDLDAYSKLAPKKKS